VTIRLRAEEINAARNCWGPRLSDSAVAPGSPWTTLLAWTTLSPCASPSLTCARADAACRIDSASRPADPLLIGERAGQPIAALSLADGTIVADPCCQRRRRCAAAPARAATAREPTPPQATATADDIPSRVLRHGDL